MCVFAGITATIDVIVLGGDAKMLCANASLPSVSMFQLVQTAQSSYKIVLARDNVTTGELPKSVNVSCASSSLPEPFQLSVHYSPRPGMLKIARGNGDADGECGRDRVICVFDANPPVNISVEYDKRGSPVEYKESCVARDENRLEISLNVTEESELVCVGENTLGSSFVSHSFKG